jgi:P27 family predicted phage terminase small subunit
MRVVPMTGQRVQPPAHLTVEQREEWESIVNSLPADYFRPGDIPLLASFCAASALYKKALLMIQEEGIVIELNGRKYAHPAKDVLTSQASAMAQMAVKLRLCPSARYSEKSAATKSSGGGSKRPWDDVAEA